MAGGGRNGPSATRPQKLGSILTLKHTGIRGGTKRAWRNCVPWGGVASQIRILSPGSGALARSGDEDGQRVTWSSPFWGRGRTIMSGAVRSLSYAWRPYDALDCEVPPCECNVSCDAQGGDRDCCRKDGANRPLKVFPQSAGTKICAPEISWQPPPEQELSTIVSPAWSLKSIRDAASAAAWIW